MKPFNLDYIIERIFKDARISKLPIMGVLMVLVVVEEILQGGDDYVPVSK